MFSNIIGSLNYNSLKFCSTKNINLLPQKLAESCKTKHPISGQIPGGQTELVECDRPVAGRFLVLYLNLTEILTVCEVQIFSSEIYYLPFLDFK